MTDQSALHNKLAGEIVASIVRPVIDSGGSYSNVLVLFESVTVGVMLVVAKLGGDNVVLDAVLQGARDRLAEMRLTDIDTKGRA